MILRNKKKIRIIIGSLNVGGTEKQLIKIINSLSEKNWEIELITLEFPQMQLIKWGMPISIC